MRVEKWHGSGNDFLVVDGRWCSPEADWSAWTRRYCDRRRGIGADGVLVLEPDAETDFRMHYRNADGAEAPMCGNGGRVLAAYAVARALGRGGEVRFRSRWGTHRARVESLSENRFRVVLRLPDVPWPRGSEIETPWGRSSALQVDCGVPHLVLDARATPAGALAEVPVEQWGAALRRHWSLGQEGANVDFVEPLAGGGVALRTFERGVEAETLSCGTGATAAAAACAYWEWASPPVRVLPWSGEALEVSYAVVPPFLVDVSLDGPAERVFETDTEAA